MHTVHMLSFKLLGDRGDFEAFCHTEATHRTDAVKSTLPHQISPPTQT